jgi:flavodoxin
MRAMVVYDSLYGNTAQIAHAIGAALSVEVHPISEVRTIPAKLDLLVIGGPTQGHGIDQPLKDFFSELPGQSVEGVAVATFDTRFHWPEFLSGSAAKEIAKRLKENGANLVAAPESFFVEGKEGPLSGGELDRATQWANLLAARFAVTV